MSQPQEPTKEAEKNNHLKIDRKGYQIRHGILRERESIARERLNSDSGRKYRNHFKRVLSKQCLHLFFQKMLG